MPNQHKVEHLVVDTTAFFKNANLQDIASNVYTVQGVVDEITNKRQLRRLVVLPYDLKIKDVFLENIKFVTEFSKKTGDYSSLSAVDIQVMALTYQLEKEYVGIAHLHPEPTVQKVDKLSETFDAAQLAIAGFYFPHRKNKEEVPETEQGETTATEEDDKPSDKDEDADGDVIVIGGDKPPSSIQAASMLLEEAPNLDPKRIPEMDIINERKAPEVGNQQIDSEIIREVLQQDKQLQIEMEETQAMRDLEEALRKTDVSETTASSWREEETSRGTDEDDSEDDEDTWDDSAWITPDNIDEAKHDVQAAQMEEKPVTVACISGDFAMQNVIKQMGMKVLAADGRVIKQLRTYILRCYSCFKTTSKKDVIFCPHCGNQTLRRAAVLLKPDGTEEIQISYRRPPTGRGKKFTLPKPQGGKHAVNPLLCPDQRLPQNFVSKLARMKNDPLEPDYVAGYSPFVMRDVTSRSAMLGIRSNHSQVKNWMRKNPNEVVKKGKKKRR